MWTFIILLFWKKERGVKIRIKIDLNESKTYENCLLFVKLNNDCCGRPGCILKTYEN